MGIAVYYAGSQYKPGKLVPIPTPPAPTPPLFVSAEIGDVDATTVVVTFDRAVLAAENDFLLGVTIKINGSAATLISGIRQTNHAIVYYALTPAVISTDTVTWEYNAAIGIIVSEIDGAALADVTAQSVTNNVAPAGPVPLLDLEADMLVLSDGDPVSTWADQSGNSRNFTQSGTARPTKQTISGYAAVVFDGSNDCMTGGAGAWIDNLESFTVITVVTYTYSGLSVILGKILNGNDAPGWYVNIFGAGILVQENGGNNYLVNSTSDIPHGTNKIVSCAQLTSLLASTTYVDFNGGGTPADSSSPPVASYASPDSLLLGCYTDTSGSGFLAASLHAVRIYSPALSSTDRAAVEAELATRYGITL